MKGWFGGGRQGEGEIDDALPLTELGSPRGEILFWGCQVQGALGQPSGGAWEAGARWV